jgi:DNA-binding CsgD family transcriptional regulator
MSKRRSEAEEIEIFLSLIHVTEAGCHEYMGGLATNGYGIFHSEGKSVLAHRYAWELVNGAVPAGMVLRHTCDNKACVFAMDSLGGFEGHIVLGTSQQNMQDKLDRDRLCRNPRKPRRVTPAEREKIALLHSQGGTYYRIGQILDRDQATVKKAVLKHNGVTSEVAA